MRTGGAVSDAAASQPLRGDQVWRPRSRARSLVELAAPTELTANDADADLPDRDVVPLTDQQAPRRSQATNRGGTHGVQRSLTKTGRPTTGYKISWTRPISPVALVGMNSRTFRSSPVRLKATTRTPNSCKAMQRSQPPVYRCASSKCPGSPAGGRGLRTQSVAHTGCLGTENSHRLARSPVSGESYNYFILI